MTRAALPRRLVAAGALALLAGCATRPPGSPTPDGLAAERGAAYASAVQLASAYEAQGRLKDALWRLRVAEALAPAGATPSARIAGLERRIAASADDLAAQGDRARRRGDALSARRDYAEALEIAPAHAHARAAMAELETPAAFAELARSGSGGPGRRKPVPQRKHAHLYAQARPAQTRR